MCSCAAELAAESAENHATSVDLQTCVGRCCLQTVWHAPYSPSSPVSWLTGHCDHDSPTSHTNKLRLTDGRLSSLLSLLQPINAGTQELHLPITWKLFQHSRGGVGQKIILDTWKKYFSDCYKKHWHFSWISWRSQRNITKVWWWHVHPGGDIRHWWWGWWN